MKELSLSEAWLDFIVTWRQSTRNAALEQDKAYVNIDEQPALLLQLAKPLSSILEDLFSYSTLTSCVAHIKYFIFRMFSAAGPFNEGSSQDRRRLTLPNYEPRRLPKRSRYSSDDSDDDQ
ncbi:hypothetical protein V3C99_007909 [Haemonchus contortus]